MVELKKKMVKSNRETEYYVKPLCCLNLMMKQTILLVLRANVCILKAEQQLKKIIWN